MTATKRRKTEPREWWVVSYPPDATGHAQSTGSRSGPFSARAEAERAAVAILGSGQAASVLIDGPEVTA